MEKLPDTHQFSSYVCLHDLLRTKPPAIPLNSIDSVSAFLLVQRQMASRVSVFRRDKDGSQEPAFPSDWLTRQLGWLRIHKWIRKHAVKDFWVMELGWASESTYHSVPRMTLDEFRRADFYDVMWTDDQLGKDLERLKVQFGWPNWQRVVVGSTPEETSVSAEYPAWLIVFAIDAPTD